MLTSLFLACSVSPPVVPEGSTLVVPADRQLEWDEDASYAAIDGVGILQPFEVMVLDPEGAPVPGAQVEALSGYDGVYVLPELHRTDGCDLNEEDCWYDLGDEVWLQTRQHIERPPVYLSTPADARGVASFALFIDSQPIDGPSFGDEPEDPASVQIYLSAQTAGADEEAATLTAAAFTLEFIHP